MKKKPPTGRKRGLKAMLRIAKDIYFIDFIDDKCVALVKKVEKKKKDGGKGEGFSTVGYYGNLKDALRGYLKAVGREPAGSMKEVLQHIKRAEDAICEISQMQEKEFKKALKAEKEKKRCKGKADSSSSTEK